MNKFVVSVLSFTAGAAVAAIGVGYVSVNRRVKKDEVRKLVPVAAEAPIKECKQALDELHTEASNFITTYYSEQVGARHAMYILGLTIDELQKKIELLSTNPAEAKTSIEELENERKLVVDQIESIILDQ